MLIILGIALSEIASIIEEKVLHDKQTPVFYVKDLKKIYQNQLKTLGASEIMIQNINLTRMKEDLLEQVPGFVNKEMESMLSSLSMMSLGEL